MNAKIFEPTVLGSKHPIKLTGMRFAGGGELAAIAALSAILIFLIGSHAIKKAGGIDTVLITTAQIVGFFVLDAYFIKFVEKMKSSNQTKQLGLFCHRFLPRGTDNADYSGLLISPRPKLYVVFRHF
jgi:hypothetical protein